jgi:hypothetical protein
MVTADELTQIQRRMVEAGITNAGAYMRKMALNGYILHVDLAPVKELVSLQRRCANNLNQVAVHANTFGVYPEEIVRLKFEAEKHGATHIACMRLATTEMGMQGGIVEVFAYGTAIQSPQTVTIDQLSIH